MSESVCSTRRLSFATLGRRRAVALLAAASLLTIAGAATADDATWDRHPPRVSRVNRPAGVPAEYVLTRNGFFHPSCVVTLRSDEVWGRDMIIRGFDGAEHDRIAPCAYPRYSASGQPIAPDAPRVGKAAERAAASTGVRHGPGGGSTYDGWVVFYDYAGTVANGSGLSTQWVVPLKPKPRRLAGRRVLQRHRDARRDLAAGARLGEIPNEWAIESENCCVQNNDVQSNLVQGQPGRRHLGRSHDGRLQLERRLHELDDQDDRRDHRQGHLAHDAEPWRSGGRGQPRRPRDLQRHVLRHVPGER